MYYTSLLRLSSSKKMSGHTHGPQYDSPLKNRVVGAIQAGKKIREAAALFNVPRSDAGRWWSNFKKRGTTHNLPRRGRPHKLTDRAKRCLVSEAVKNRRVTLRALGQLINPQVSGSTARRVLADAGYHRRVAVHKPYLTKEHKILRQKWAKKYEHWRTNQWMHVIWSDECYVHMDDNGGPVYVTRRPDETLDDGCTIKSFKQSNIRVMVWGCIAYDKKGPLLLLDYPGGRGGGMNSERYAEQVLCGSLLGFYNSMKKQRRYMSFQQDNAPIHVSKSTIRWLNRNNVRLFPHPASSPDLNPIENLWHLLKIRIRAREHHPTSTAELQQAVQEAWESLTVDDINVLVRSMPDRVHAVLQAKGGHTRF